MAKTKEYISINEILDRLKRNPLLEDIDMDVVVRHLADFIAVCGYYPMYEHREDNIEIVDYRGVLPCEVISVDMVVDKCSGRALRAMTDILQSKDTHTCNPCVVQDTEKSWKIQGKVLYTSFKEGEVVISYSSIKTDADGYPMLIDGVFTKAFEAYIKKEEYSLLFDQGKINQQVLNHAEQQYGWLSGQLRSDLLTPDYSEMESIRRYWNSFIQTDTHFHNHFRDLGNQEYIRIH